MGWEWEWDSQGWCGSTGLGVTGAWCLTGSAAQSPAQGFAEPGQTKREKTCLLDIFPLQIMISAGSACLQRISRKRKNTHTQNGFVQIENKKLPDVPCSSLPAPSKKYWQKMEKGSQKTFEEKY